MTREVLIELADEAATTAREHIAAAIEHAQTGEILQHRVVDALGGARMLPSITARASVPAMCRVIDECLAQVERQLRKHSDWTLTEDVAEIRSRIRLAEEAYRRYVHETQVAEFFLTQLVSPRKD